MVPAGRYVSRVFLYLVLVVISVIMLLNAIMPTFNIQTTGTGDVVTGHPRSMIFYQHILDVDAPGWGAVFRELGIDDGKLLKKKYTKCYVAESYLLAKSLDKKFLRVRKGIRYLLSAMCFLLLFVILFALTIMNVEPTRLS